MNGFLNLYKPKGVSSAKILNAIKKSIRGISVGHMGTLDPLASGVLPVAIGKSTRLFDYTLDKIKVYDAVFAFGFQTDTLDLEGKVVKTSDVVPSEEEAKEKAALLTGEIMQTPPAFSAKCVNGKRSYQLARKGEEVSLPPKKVEIISIEYLGKRGDNEFKFRISCKGGTYIRSIARDLAELCGTVGTMTDLERMASGPFLVENSVTAEDFINAEDKESLLLPPETVVSYPKLFLDDRQTTRLFNGLRDEYDISDGLYSIYSANGFYGVGEVSDRKIKVKAYIEDENYRIRRKD